MTKNTYLIPSKAASKLKQRARDLKRQSDLSHTQALDSVARDIPIPSWKKVAEGVKTYAPFENAFTAGVIAAYDGKESPDPERLKGALEYWPFGIMPMLWEDIVRWWGDLPAEYEDDPEGRPNRIVLPEREIQEACSDIYDGMQLFLIEEMPAAMALEKCLEDLVFPCSFFGPRFIWFRGTFHPIG